ncbi:MAG: alpha/beta fold hydrolase [Mycobacteriaceae bacterium]|nr:alpha/beta fold hydrolase [Mycobacteriaceae bacterium]
MRCQSAVAVLAAALLLGASQVAAADPAGVPAGSGPPQSDHGQAAVYARRHPDAVPAGVNDFGCKPAAGRRFPVVLAHGTDSNAYSDWAGIAPLLVRAGYCVFAPNYGGLPGATTFGLDDMFVGARQIAAFVDRVLHATGARQVDLVGFSQGATVTRLFVNRLGGAPKVRKWVGLASPSYGGTFYGVVPLVQAIPGLTSVATGALPAALVQQMQGSEFLAALNAGGDTVAGPDYTTIGSRVDEVIQPYTNIALRSPGARNVLLQELCPADLTGHFHLPYDPFVQQLLLHTLAGADTPRPQCRPVPMGTGIPSVIWSAHFAG